MCTQESVARAPEVPRCQMDARKRSRGAYLRTSLTASEMRLLRLSLNAQFLVFCAGLETARVGDGQVIDQRPLRG